MSLGNGPSLGFDEAEENQRARKEALKGLQEMRREWETFRNESQQHLEYLKTSPSISSADIQQGNAMLGQAMGMLDQMMTKMMPLIEKRFAQEMEREEVLFKNYQTTRDKVAEYALKGEQPPKALQDLFETDKAAARAHGIPLGNAHAGEAKAAAPGFEGISRNELPSFPKDMKAQSAPSEQPSGPGYVQTAPGTQSEPGRGPRG